MWAVVSKVKNTTYLQNTENQIHSTPFTILQVSGGSVVSNAEVDKFARFHLEILAFVSDVLFSSVQMSASLKPFSSQYAEAYEPM
jgi:hypothetical protein